MSESSHTDELGGFRVRQESRFGDKVATDRLILDESMWDLPRTNFFAQKNRHACVRNLDLYRKSYYDDTICAQKNWYNDVESNHLSFLQKGSNCATFLAKKSFLKNIIPFSK